MTLWFALMTTEPLVVVVVPVMSRPLFGDSRARSVLRTKRVMSVSSAAIWRIQSGRSCSEMSEADSFDVATVAARAAGPVGFG